MATTTIATAEVVVVAIIHMSKSSKNNTTGTKSTIGPRYVIFTSTGYNRWGIFTASGRLLFESRFSKLYLAMEECRAFMSSWYDVQILYKVPEEEEKKTDGQ